MLEYRVWHEHGRKKVDWVYFVLIRHRGRGLGEVGKSDHLGVVKCFAHPESSPYNDWLLDKYLLHFLQIRLIVMIFRWEQHSCRSIARF